MSSKDGSMAAQGAFDVAVTIPPPLAPHNQQGHTSSSFSGNSFVRSIDKKARSYLKTFERSFSFSIGESRDEDPSSMTIEFLKARLQAQRAEYRAEKQKAQHLAKKVLELEQRLNSEIERRKKAEHNDRLISPRYRNKLRSFHSYNDRMELAKTNSKFRGTSSGEQSDCCSEISGSEDSVFLISPSSLLARDITEASAIDKESRMLNDAEQRNKQDGGSRCKMYPSPLKLKGSKNLDTWNTKDDIDLQPSEVVSTFNNSTAGDEEPLFPEQFVLQNQPHVQPCTVYEIDNRIESERAHYIVATKEKTPRLINHHVNSMFNCQNCQQPIPQYHIRPADERISGNSPSQNGVYALETQKPLEAKKTSEFGTVVKPRLSKSSSTGQNQILKYMFAHSTTNKDEAEEEPTLKQVAKSEYVKAILPLDVIKTLEDHEISLLRLSSEKLPYPCKKAFADSYSFTLPLHQRGRLQGYRMSLDGGMDRLQDMRHKDRQSMR